MLPRKKSQITLKILLILIGVDLIETFAQFCFKKSSLPFSNIQINTLGDSSHFLAGILLSPFFWLGLISVVLIFISWVTILSRIDLSVAVPVCSFSYITVPLVSVFIFHEKISVLRWSGIFVILLGVILVSISSSIKEKA
jgi:drug/metabolite transporter (DMT)-like permease